MIGASDWSERVLAVVGAISLAVWTWRHLRQTRREQLDAEFARFARGGWRT